MARPRNARSVVLELTEQLHHEVHKLTTLKAFDEQGRLRKQIDEAVDAVGRHFADALDTDRDFDFARHVRLARASSTDVRDGLQAALVKRCVSEGELRQVRVVLGRLYPALNSLLVLTASFRVRTPAPAAAGERRVRVD